MHFSVGLGLPCLWNRGYMSTMEYLFTQFYINILTFVSPHKIAETKEIKTIMQYLCAYCVSAQYHWDFSLTLDIKLALGNI